VRPKGRTSFSFMFFLKGSEYVYIIFYNYQYYNLLIILINLFINLK